jgi:hypothetical protein
MEAVVKEHVEGGDKARRVNHISRTNSTHSTTSIGALHTHYTTFAKSSVMATSHNYSVCKCILTITYAAEEKLWKAKSI